MDDSRIEGEMNDFIQKCGVLLRILSEEALKSSAEFAQACGRNNVVGGDMIMALKYQAHEFFLSDIDAKFLEYLAEDREAETTWISQFVPPKSGEEDGEDGEDGEEGEEGEEDGEEGEEGEEEEEEEEGEEEEFTSTLSATATSAQQTIHGKMMHYSTNWDEWIPEDRAQILIKSSIDKMIRNFQSSP